MMQILAVAHNTFREAVRDKVLYVLLLFAAATILSSKALGWVSIEQDIKILKDFSLASISVFGALIAIFVGTNLVYKEIDKRTIYTIVCRPMPRASFILGKFFGMALLLATITLIMAVLGIAYVYSFGGSIGVVFLYAILLIYIKLLMITSLALLLSSLTSPILGAIIVFCFYIVGHGTGILLNLPEALKDTFWGGVLNTIYYVVPNLSNLNITTEAANDVAVSFYYVVWASCYGFIHIVLFLVLAAIAFDNKDL